MGFTLYRTANPAPFDETQKGLVLEYDTPQAFFRCGSVSGAAFTDWSSVTRFVTPNDSAPAGALRPNRNVTSDAARRDTFTRVDMVDLQFSAGVTTAGLDPAAVVLGCIAILHVARRVPR